jgi:hypothetical protein
VTGARFAYPSELRGSAMPTRSGEPPPIGSAIDRAAPAPPAAPQTRFCRVDSRDGALGAFGSLNPGLAKAPMLGTQAPAFYRFKIGDFEATIATDGGLPLGDPHKNYIGLSPEETDRQLSQNFLPTDNTILEQNALIVNTGDKLILFDTGLGNLHLFGPTTGRLQSSLKAAGIDHRTDSSRRRSSPRSGS